MATVNFTTTNNKIEGRLNKLIGKMKNPRAFLNSTIYTIYVNAQIDRWKTQNVSEGDQWPEFVDPKYVEYKRKKYGKFPGGGNVMMIAKGPLSMAAQGRGPGFNKTVTERSLVIAIDDGAIPYAKYTAIKRPFMAFGSNTQEKITEAIREFFLGGD